MISIFSEASQKPWTCVYIFLGINPTGHTELILGALGLSRLEELELGVETVKQRILTSTENEEQKSLLIEKERFIQILRVVHSKLTIDYFN